MKAKIAKQKAQEIEPALVSEKAAALFLGVCQRTLWSMRQANEIPFVRLRGRVMYSLDSLRQWIIDGQKANMECARR